LFGGKGLSFIYLFIQEGMLDSIILRYSRLL